MNERSPPFADQPADGQGWRIVLAGEPDFALGRLQVRPSRGEIHGDDAPERLEPRVMQVLVALARRRGETVPRQELIDRCWGGVVVGKDAVNRVISLLRGVAERSEGSFRIETLARIGYRLVIGKPAPEGVGAAAFDERIIAVLPFDSEDGASTSLLADGISEAILSGLTRNGGIAVAARHSSLQFRGARKIEAASALGASHLVDGSVAADGDVLRVTAYLIDAIRQLTLWSEQFDGSVSRVFEVQDKIARRVVETLDLRLGRRQSAISVDPMAHDLYTRALLALEQPAREPVEQALAYLTDVVRRAPGFALGWAGLAEAQRRRMLYEPPLLQESLRAKSRFSAECALDLDRDLGQAYGTLANLLPRFGRWREVERLFDRGLAITPESPELRHLHAQFLMSVGRTREGLSELLALQRINPLSASVAVEVASALMDCGLESEALVSADRAFALWPNIMLVWSETIRLHLVAGHYAVVKSMLDAPPPTVAADDPNLARRRLHLAAIRDRRPEDLDAATANFESFAKLGGAPSVVAIHALTTLGRDRQALAIADETFQLQSSPSIRPGVNMMGTYALAGEPDSTVLFRRDTASIRGERQFNDILARIGLEDYWRESGIAPTFRG
jgi:TolB-like protein/tetratricopeptide (TPR) repeat protein